MRQLPRRASVAWHTPDSRVRGEQDSKLLYLPGLCPRGRDVIHLHVGTGVLDRESCPTATAKKRVTILGCSFTLLLRRPVSAGTGPAKVAAAGAVMVLIRAAALNGARSSAAAASQTSSMQTLLTRSGAPQELLHVPDVLQRHPSAQHTRQEPRMRDRTGD